MSIFPKFWLALFSCYLRFEIRPFASLPTNLAVMKLFSPENLPQSILVILHDNFIPELQSPSETNKLQFLCCQNGVQLASNVVAHIAFTRIHLCRDLFILLKLMINLSAKVGLLHFLCYSKCPWYFRSCKKITKNKQKKH